MARTVARPKNSTAEGERSKAGPPLDPHLVQSGDEESAALDLDAGVFTWNDPKRIAASLKRSAERSHRRKAKPYRSALSMLVFYINRAGKNLPASRRRTLEQAKTELRKQFGRE